MKVNILNSMSPQLLCLLPIFLVSSLAFSQAPREVLYQGKTVLMFPEEINYRAYLFSPNLQYQDSCNLPDGYYVLSKNGGTEFVDAEGEMRNGHPHGIWKRYQLEFNSFGEWRGHLSFEASYDEGVYHGPQKYYDTSERLLSITNYRNGLPEGDYTRYFEDGESIMEQGQHYEGLKVGAWTYYSFPGIRLYQVQHIDSFPKDSLSFYRQDVAGWVPSLPEGIIKPTYHGVYRYFEHGKIKYEITFDHGRAEYLKLLNDKGQTELEGKIEKMHPDIPKTELPILVDHYTPWKVFPLTKWESGLDLKPKKLKKPVLIQKFGLMD